MPKSPSSEYVSSSSTVVSRHEAQDSLIAMEHDVKFVGLKLVRCRASIRLASLISSAQLSRVPIRRHA